MRRWLLLLFLGTLAIDWPQLPVNARVTDVIFTAAALAVFGGQPRWSRPRPTALDLAILGYLAGSLPAVMLSPDARASAVELMRQLYLVAIYAGIAVAVRHGLGRTVADGMALSGLVPAAIGLGAVAVYYVTGLQTPAMTPVMTLPYVGATLRLRALTASEAMLACVLAMSVPFVVLHPAAAASRLRAVAAAILPGVAALLTYSHSVAGVAVAALMASWNRIRSRAPLGIAALGVTVLIVLALNFAASFSIRSIGTSPLRDDTVFHYAVDRGRTRIAGIDVEYQTMSYLRLKQVAWNAFRSHSLFGIGLDRFHSVTEVAYAQGRLTAPYRAIDPHSTFFGRFAEAGIAGGLTLIALWIVVVVTLARLVARQPHDWIVTAVAAGLAGTLVNTMNADVMNLRFLWAALGLVRGLDAVRRNAAITEP